MDKAEIEKYQNEYREWNDYYSNFKSNDIENNIKRSYFPNGYIIQDNNGSKRLYPEDQSWFRLKMDVIGEIVVFFGTIIG